MIPVAAATAVGAIAQLGERLNGIQEVGGSIPPGSTKTISDQRCLSSRRFNTAFSFGCIVLRDCRIARIHASGASETYPYRLQIDQKRKFISEILIK